jgi:hypothetical protein
MSTRTFHVLAPEHLTARQAQVPDILKTNHSIRFAPNERKEPPTPKKTPIKEPKRRKKPIGDPPSKRAPKRVAFYAMQESNGKII